MAAKAKTEQSPEQKALILEYQELVGYAEPLKPFIDAPHGVDAWVRTKIQEVAGVAQAFEWKGGAVTKMNCDASHLKQVERLIGSLHTLHQEELTALRNKETEEKTRRTQISDTYERLKRKAEKLGVDTKKVQDCWPGQKRTDGGFIVDEQLTQKNLDAFTAAITPLIEEGERKLQLLKGLPDGLTSSEAEEVDETKAGAPPEHSSAATDVEDEPRDANAKCVCGSILQEATREELDRWEEMHEMCVDEVMAQALTCSESDSTTTDTATTAELTAEEPASPVDSVEDLETSTITSAEAVEETASSNQTEHHCDFDSIADGPDGTILERCSACGTMQERQLPAVDMPSQDEIRRMLLADGIINDAEAPQTGMNRLQLNFGEGVMSWYISKVRALQHEVEDLLDQVVSRVAIPLRKIEALNYHLEGHAREYLRDTLPRYDKNTKNHKAGDFRRKSLDFDTGRGFLRSEGGWVITDEGALRAWLQELVGDLNQHIPEDLREDFGVRAEIKFSRTKVKARAAAGEDIPHTQYRPFHEAGKFGIGGSGNHPWTFASAKLAFSKKLACLVLNGEDRLLDDGRVIDVTATTED